MSSRSSELSALIAQVEYMIDMAEGLDLETAIFLLSMVKLELVTQSANASYDIREPCHDNSA